MKTFFEIELHHLPKFNTKTYLQTPLFVTREIYSPDLNVLYVKMFLTASVRSSWSGGLTRVFPCIHSSPSPGSVPSSSSCMVKGKKNTNTVCSFDTNYASEWSEFHLWSAGRIRHHGNIRLSVIFWERVVWMYLCT